LRAPDYRVDAEIQHVLENAHFLAKGRLKTRPCFAISDFEDKLTGEALPSLAT
jgi:hypothetical protein